VRHRRHLLNRAERERLIEEVLDETFGLGPLELLLKDRDQRHHDQRAEEHLVEKRGKMEKSERHVPRQRPLAADHRPHRVEGRSPRRRSLPDGRRPLPDGSRVNAIIPPLALDGAAVSIRRFGAIRSSSKTCSTTRAFTPEMVMLLEGAIKARLNMIISGGTGSGKTTLLNTLSSFISNEPHRHHRRRGGTAVAARARRAAGNPSAQYRRQGRSRRPTW
jgi:pilus assembly protein CpaF